MHCRKNLLCVASFAAWLGCAVFVFATDGPRSKGEGRAGAVTVTDGAVNNENQPGATEPVVNLEKMEIDGGRSQAFYNTIDRKVYDVGKDLQSAGGSASDLLQNVPSVQVDIEGNVALRGDSNVLILIDGKTSTMMGKNRAAVLEQMPAESIESIEVITNPSAKYKPDGTAGIINIRMKKKQASAIYAGSLRATVGNDSRYSVGVFATANVGKFTGNVSANVRRDYRPRKSQDERTRFDAVTGALISTTSQHTEETARPLTRIFQGGIEYNFDKRTSLGATVRYNNRDFDRYSTVTTVVSGVGAQDYDRLRYDPEYETDLEFAVTAKHSFGGDADHELAIEVKHGKTNEQEDNHYRNVYRAPFTRPDALDAELVRNMENSTEISVDYALPLGEESKFEAGYDGQFTQLDQDFRGSFFDEGAQIWLSDVERTNRFLCDTDIHAVYATFAHKIGDFGFLAGLRFENERTKADQRTRGVVVNNDHNSLYPSLHLSYDLTDTQQLQANYSHRVHRPDPDDMNPFAEYQDPLNLRQGNPHLRAEDIHSIEAGWQFRKKETTLFATAYYRYRYNGITSVSRTVDAQLQPDPMGVILLTTKENLSTSRSGGAEFGAQARLRKSVSLNVSGNVYRNTINASNLGFFEKRSTTAWDAKCNVNWDATKSTLVQMNANYTAKRLTPQGYREPTWQANVGVRQNFFNKRLAVIASVSDVFDTLRERTRIETAVLHQRIERRRTSRIFNVGVIWNFGKAPNKQKDDMQFETGL